MKLKKCMKRISAIILAATMVVVALPNQPIVKADDTDVPDEILFPINILDFPADNLFFECPMNWMGGYDSYLDLTSQNIPGVNDGGEAGKKLVADKLETDKSSIYYGLPVYREETVDYIARRVLATLNETSNTDYVFNKQYVDGKINPLCMKNYIRKQDWKVINTEDGELENGARLGNNDNCLKGQYVGYLGGPTNGSVKLKYNATFAGNHDVRIFYMSGENRNLYITVNGVVNGPYTCNNESWANPGQTPMVKSVSGFKVGANTIVISGDGEGGWAPDVDRIEIQNLRGDEPEPVDPNEYFSVEAENAGSQIMIKSSGGDGVGHIENADHSSEGYSKGYADIDWWNWNDNESYRSGDFDLDAGYDAGYYDIKVYLTRTSNNYIGFIVNNNKEQGIDPARRNDNPKVAQFVISNVYLNKSNNYIRFRGDHTKLDKFVICKAGTASLSGVPSPDDYPLGTYAESKAKYNIDEDGDKVSDYGWYDIETCYDYAYFITANLFKHHPTLNTVYNKYTNLVFHKVNQDGKNYYEFMGDQIHNESIEYIHYNNEGKEDGYRAKINAVYDKLGSDATDAEREADLNKYNAVRRGIGRLVYNPDTRMIRNACDAKGNYVGPSGSEYVTNSGYMFVCDGDEANKNPAHYDAGYGIKKYPTLDPSKRGDDGKQHNFNYTIRTHSRFVYKDGTGQQFFFSGDDDVYVFVNGNLIVDLGGQHQQLDGSINLDTLAELPGNPYGLIPNKAVDFDFFYIERHSTASNFWGKMSFQLRNDEVELLWPSEPDDIAGMTDTAIPYGYTIDLNYQFSSLRDLSTSGSITFHDDIGNYIGADKFELCDEVKLGNKYKVMETDSSGVDKIVTKEDPTKYHMSAVVHRIQPDDTYKDEVYDFAFNDPHEFSPDEIKAVTDFFKALTLEQEDRIEISGIMYDTSKKKFTDFEVTDKASVRKLNYKVHVDYMTYMTMGGTNAIEDTEGFKQSIEGDVIARVVIGALKISCSVEGLDENYEIKDDLSQFGDFKLKRLENEDDLSTPDVDERYVYSNKFDLRDSGNVIIFDAEPHPELVDPETGKAPIEPGPIPKGTYDLEMDINKLTGYDLVAEVWVDDELKVVVSRTTKMKYNEYKVDAKDPDYLIEDIDPETESLETVLSLEKIRIKVEPKLNGEEWDYPKVEYKLKAYRSVNPLKDLT